MEQCAHMWMKVFEAGTFYRRGKRLQRWGDHSQIAPLPQRSPKSSKPGPILLSVHFLLLPFPFPRPPLFPINSLQCSSYLKYKYNFDNFDTCGIIFFRKKSDNSFEKVWQLWQYVTAAWELLWTCWHFRNLRTSIHDNQTYLTGHSSQFLQCFGNACLCANVFQYF